MAWGGESSLHHSSGSPSAKERSQNSLESVALSYAQGGTESDGDVCNGFQMSGCSCLLSSERQGGLGWGETCSLPLSPTCISGGLTLLEPWVEGCAALVNKLRDEGRNEWMDEGRNEWMVQGTTFLICKVGIVTPRSITPSIP